MEPSKVTVTYEFNNLWHFNLRKDASGDVVSKASGVANGECVWALDGDFPRLAAIEFLHSLDF